MLEKEVSMKAGDQWVLLPMHNEGRALDQGQQVPADVTLWQLFKLAYAIHPVLTGFGKVVISIQGFQGFPCLLTPFRNISDTLVNPAVFLGDIGICSPDHHLADIRWVLCSSDERSYAAITPAQEGDLLEL